MTDPYLVALRASAEHLRDVVGVSDDAAITKSAYPAAWTIADVVSHLGSGAVITRRRLEDELGGRAMPDDFATATWDAWNAKPPRAQVDDGLAADAALLVRLEAVGAEARRSFSFAMGAMTFDFGQFVGLRLNEHAFHTWDIEVALDASAVIPDQCAGLIVDNLGLVARHTATASGPPAALHIRTMNPERSFVIAVDDEGVTIGPLVAGDTTPDLELPAEAFARLVYGRLDQAHTPDYRGDPAILERLRNTFPGP